MGVYLFSELFEEESFKSLVSKLSWQDVVFCHRIGIYMLEDKLFIKKS